MESNSGKETLEEMKTRHKKEVKDLQGKITSLKKQMKSSDKATKKKLAEEIEALPKELEKRHNDELLSVQVKSLEINDSSEPQEALNNTDILNEQDQNKEEKTSNVEKGGKQRQKKRREKKLLHLEELANQAEQEALLMQDHGKIEADLLNAVLAPLKLKVYNIKPDGHCLYGAISDQLAIKKKINMSVHELRELASKYMISNYNDFMPFMLNEETGELYEHAQFLEHCEKIANSALWGGQNEITAIANSLNIPIYVYQATTKFPIKTIPSSCGDSDDALSISFHQHEFGLGEHYNSLRPYKSN
ncbi:hypothetical protein BB560_000592 [Smittium megazygosporum]|uniref:OTU domain-containing protein n=1 Tax=Smittium megazygosporum TaxID=133381 RepID=A0A2T9ZJU2_9FUNG|nr:hypothetical protein BB560_000592 [Smittium megazygosporum]